MGDHHRGLTQSAERDSASTINAPRQRPAVELQVHRRIADERTDTTAEVERVVKTPAPAQQPAAGHQKVGPDKRTGSSVISTTQKPVTPTKPKALEAIPSVPVDGPIEAGLEKSPSALKTLLEKIAQEELLHPKKGTDKDKRALWMSRSLLDLARMLLDKWPNLQTLRGNPNERNDLIRKLREPVKETLGSEQVKMPNFLGY